MADAPRTPFAVRAEGGYGAVLAERPVRRLLTASLGGRLAFSMLPLGLVLLATSVSGSPATAGGLIAAFSLSSALAPLRGRVGGRRAPGGADRLRRDVRGRARGARRGGPRGRAMGAAARPRRAGGDGGAAARPVH